jgi:hypothetical protein
MMVPLPGTVERSAKIAMPELPAPSRRRVYCGIAAGGGAFFSTQTADAFLIMIWTHETGSRNEIVIESQRVARPAGSRK